MLGLGKAAILFIGRMAKAVLKTAVGFEAGHKKAYQKTLRQAHRKECKDNVCIAFAGIPLIISLQLLCAVVNIQLVVCM